MMIQLGRTRWKAKCSSVAVTVVAWGCAAAVASCCWPVWFPEHQWNTDNGLIPARHSFHLRELSLCAPICCSYFNCLPYLALACPLIVYFSKHSRHQWDNMFFWVHYLSIQIPYLFLLQNTVSRALQVNFHRCIARQISWRRAKQRHIFTVLFRWCWIRLNVLGTEFVPQYHIVHKHCLLIKCHQASQRFGILGL